MRRLVATWQPTWTGPGLTAFAGASPHVPLPERCSTRSSRSSTRSASVAPVARRARHPDRPGQGHRRAPRRGPGRSRAGRGRARPEHRRAAAAQLAFRAEAGHVLVADLGATSIDVAVTSLDGRILGHHDEPARVEDGPERVSSRVDELFGALLGDPGHPRAGCGASASGSRARWSSTGGRSRRRSCRAGTATRSANGSPSAIAAPVWVDNDVNILALGEWRSGVAPGHDNVVVIKIGTGIGAGIISDGRLHRGAQGSAGDVGHIQVVDDASVVCRCGNVGCLEAFGRWGGARATGRGCGARRAPRPAPAAFERARRADGRGHRAGRAFGDPVAVGLFLRAARRVGSDDGLVVNFFNPSADRHRWRGRPERGPAARRHPRNRLPALTPPGHARPA